MPWGDWPWGDWKQRLKWLWLVIAVGWWLLIALLGWMLSLQDASLTASGPIRILLVALGPPMCLFLLGRAVCCGLPRLMGGTTADIDAPETRQRDGIGPNDTSRRAYEPATLPGDMTTKPPRIAHSADPVATPTTAVSATIITLEDAAQYPLGLLFHHQTPFSEDLAAGVTVPPQYREFFLDATKTYQLYIYYVYAISEIGEAAARWMLSHQVERLNDLSDSWQGDLLAARFELISASVGRYIDNATASLPFNQPIEQSVAVDLLIQDDLSPDRLPADARRGSHPPSPTDINAALAECLGQAKDRALAVFSLYFKTVIIEV